MFNKSTTILDNTDNIYLQKLTLQSLNKKGKIIFPNLKKEFIREFGYLLSQNYFSNIKIQEVFRLLDEIDIIFYPFKKITILKKKKKGNLNLKERFVGKIIYWNRKKGFGFIKPQCSTRIGISEIYIHQSEIMSIGQRDLKVKALVEFSRGLTRSGNLCAVQVTSPGGLYLHDSKYTKWL